MTDPRNDAFPASPLDAATHPDPYPYYAGLVAETPLYRDRALGLWVAADAAAVSAVLASELCRVRPPGEPVPQALVGSAAGDIFGRLVRMTDGAGRCPARRAVAATFAALDAAASAEASRACAEQLADRRLADFAVALPAHVVASLLGVPAELHSETASWTAALVGSFAPDATPAAIASGTAAAARLDALFRALLAAPHGDGLLARLDREARLAGWENAEIVVANGIGFLTQAYEATAGLIGNTLVALGRNKQLRAEVAGDPGLLRDVVREVLRFDPPVHATRRFVAADGIVAGRAMAVGDTIFVMLAAAGRDPAANRDPARFVIDRPDRRSFAFGLGRHACPGESLAVEIAAAGVAALLRRGFDPATLPSAVQYRPSSALRVPLLRPAPGVAGAACHAAPEAQPQAGAAGG